MNNKGKGATKSYVLVFVVMFIAMISIFGLLELAKIDRKAIPINQDEETSTTRLMYDEEVKDNISSNNENVPIVNFSEPLLSIISKYNFYGDYEIETSYNGVNFNFNCTAYDQTNETCISGSGLMTINNNLIPLYTYASDEDNYLKNPNDIYIILNEQYVVIVKNRVGISAGDAKIYDRNGLLLGVVENVITGYRRNNELVPKLYPNFIDNTFNYYMCDNNAVKIATVEMVDFNNVIIDEVVEGVSCY